MGQISQLFTIRFYGLPLTPMTEESGIIIIIIIIIITLTNTMGSSQLRCLDPKYSCRQQCGVQAVMDSMWQEKTTGRFKKNPDVGGSHEKK